MKYRDEKLSSRVSTHSVSRNDRNRDTHGEVEGGLISASPWHGSLMLLALGQWNRKSSSTSLL